MRESIGGAWLLGVVMTFMMLMVAFISISLNYSAAFDTKGKIITAIEEYQGVNTKSINKIKGILKNHSSNALAGCRYDYLTEEAVGIKANDEAILNPTTPQQLCIKKERIEGNIEKYYYEVEVFFGFSLPIFGDLFTFRIKDKTNYINYPNDTLFTN